MKDYRSFYICSKNLLSSFKMRMGNVLDKQKYNEVFMKYLAGSHIPLKDLVIDSIELLDLILELLNRETHSCLMGLEKLQFHLGQVTEAEAMRTVQVKIQSFKKAKSRNFIINGHSFYVSILVY
jgi:hypothetical protein